MRVHSIFDNLIDASLLMMFSLSSEKNPRTACQINNVWLKDFLLIDIQQQQQPAASCWAIYSNRMSSRTNDTFWHWMGKKNVAYISKCPHFNGSTSNISNPGTKALEKKTLCMCNNFGNSSQQVVCLNSIEGWITVCALKAKLSYQLVKKFDDRSPSSNKKNPRVRSK